MKKAFTLTFCVVLVLFVVISLTAQTTPDMEITLTTTVSDPEVKAVPSSIELFGLRTATPTARVCYDYVTQSGKVTRTECRAVTGDQLSIPTDTTALLDYITPRTSTTQPAGDVRRFVNRIRLWTEDNGGPPNPPTTTT